MSQVAVRCRVALKSAVRPLVGALVGPFDIHPLSGASHGCINNTLGPCVPMERSFSADAAAWL